jgi:hypothetical protein
VKTDGRPIRFIDADGRCVVCSLREGLHLDTCPIVVLDAQVRELAAHIGLFVANVKETMDTIGRTLRDERRY